MQYSHEAQSLHRVSSNENSDSAEDMGLASGQAVRSPTSERYMEEANGNSSSLDFERKSEGERR